MTEDTNELRKLAEAATPGPWKAEKYGITGAGDRDVVSWDYALNDTDRGSEGTDKEFIAAANPTAILSLLDRLAAMTERAEKAERERDEWKAMHASCIAVAVSGPMAEVARLRAKLAEMERERDEARSAVEMLGMAQTLTLEDRFAEAVERIASTQRVRWVDSATGEYMEAFRGLSRSAVAQGVASFFGLLREWTYRTALTRAEDTIAKLREAMPSDDERDAIECAILDDADSFERQCVREWLARFDAARGGAK